MKLAGVLKALAGESPRALLIVPPFAAIDRPSLGIHLLQAVARQVGHEVRVLYANLLLARQIGLEFYRTICYAPTGYLLGERFFTLAAFAEEPRGAATFGERRTQPSVDDNFTFDFARYDLLRKQAADWCDELVRQIAQYSFRVVGATTTFEQTSASIAILNRIKRLSPETVTIIGGANCEGEMAHGIASLPAAVDHIFSGESEATFPAFLTGLTNGQPLTEKILEGTPNFDLEGLPTPSFDDYYTQFQMILGETLSGSANDLWLPYESSRGCWWGQKHHCTFCGINGRGMAFRQKSPNRVVQELTELRRHHPSSKVAMVDNIMPHSYFRELLPRLGQELPGLHIFYEQKANLTLDKLRILESGGVAAIQPGIEAFSTPLLKLMKKGVSASQNIASLRYAASIGITMTWNLLCGFPNDKATWYEQTAEILPSLRHLPPPTGLFRLSIDRFSPYHNQPRTFGIQNMRAGVMYHAAFPAETNIEKLAYHFEADYLSGSLAEPEVVEALAAEVSEWISSWKGDEAPQLLVSKLAPDEFILLDTRGMEGNNVIEFITEEQATVALGGATQQDGDNATTWALEHKICLLLDGKIVPLAIASPELLHEVELGMSDRRHDDLAPRQQSRPISAL